MAMTPMEHWSDVPLLAHLRQLWSSGVQTPDKKNTTETNCNQFVISALLS